MSIEIPFPKNKETRGEYMRRCSAIKIDPSDSKWSDPNRVVAACEANWGKARKAAGMIMGSGDNEMLFSVNQPLSNISASIQIKANDNAEIANEFFATLLNSVTISHILHLQTRSFSAHMALGGLYEGLEDLSDTLIEAYQGKYGIVDFPSQSVEPQPDALNFVKSLRAYISDSREAIGSDSELQNITDEIVQLLDSTIYKLSFLS